MRTEAVRVCRGDHAVGPVAIVVADAPLADVVAEASRASGYDVFVPDTPLDLIQTLIQLGDRIAAVLVSPRATWAAGLREYLADEYPQIDHITLAA